MADKRPWHPGRSDKNMIEFGPLSTLQPGGVFALLERIYRDYPFMGDHQKIEWWENWKQYDHLVFENMNTVGKAGFITVIESYVIGFCSWDPRNAPEYAILGHNGIIPEYRGKKYGKQQIGHAMAILKEKGIAKACVTTEEGAFFIPAQKMYLDCGFVETGRQPQNGNNVIHFEITL